MLAVVFFGIGEVVFSMRDVKIAAKYDRFLLFELLAIGEEGRIPDFVTQG